MLWLEGSHHLVISVIFPAFICLSNELVLGRAHAGGGGMAGRPTESNFSAKQSIDGGEEAEEFIYYAFVSSLGTHARVCARKHLLISALALLGSTPPFAGTISTHTQHPLLPFLV